MKKPFLSLAAILMFASSLLALPLTATIFQESARLQAKVATWNKQCGGKAESNESCDKRRHAISRELGEFVALVNDELSFIQGPMSPDAPPDFVREIEGRRKIMEVEARIALHNMKWLGLSMSDPKRKSEMAALENDKAALQSEYALTHSKFDGKWVSLHVESISPAPKK